MYAYQYVFYSSDTKSTHINLTGTYSTALTLYLHTYAY